MTDSTTPTDDSYALLEDITNHNGFYRTAPGTQGVYAMSADVVDGSPASIRQDEQADRKGRDARH